jgi:hypothetical protein
MTQNTENRENDGSDMRPEIGKCRVLWKSIENVGILVRPEKMGYVV